MGGSAVCNRFANFPVQVFMEDSASRFEAFVRAFSAELYRYAYWLCRHRAQAEDLVQETFTRAWRAIHSLEDERAARRWLYTILRREWARTFEKFQPEIVDLDTVQLSAPVDLDTRTEAVVLRRAIGELPENYREPLVLQVLGGFSCAEIGDILDISANTVMTRLFRARKKLRDHLVGNPAVKRKEGWS